MQLSIDGRKIDITPAIRDHVEQKIQKLKKYFPYLIDVHVVLFTQKYMQGADITIKANRFTIHGEEISNDLYASIDKVIDKMDSQLRKYKEKLIKQHQKQQRQDKDIDLGLNISIYGREEIEDSHPSPEMIHHKRLVIQPMSVDEAVMQMDLISHEFLVFRNYQTDKLNIVYRREDGHYGVIEPELA